MELAFLEAKDRVQIERLADCAKEIWLEYYPGIITMEQVLYMIETFQSPDAMEAQILHGGYQYFLVLDGSSVLGYLAFKAEEDKLFLSKLYLKKEARGKGYFSGMLSFAEQAARSKNLTRLYLTVNKYNDDSIAVYRKKGFSVVKEQVADIGGGFVMDDYVMEKTI